MIYIVGGNGMIGSHLKRTFQNWVPFVLQESSNWNFSSVTKDDFVIFLRAVSSPFKVFSDPIFSKEINVTKTIEAISTMLTNGARIVFASSDVVYGETKNLIVDETMHINPFGEYAIQKASVEAVFKDHANFLSVRISSVVGEGSNLRKLLLSQQNVEIYDPIMRTPIHINDLVVIFLELLKSDFRNDFPNGILNVGGRNPMSNFEVAKLEAGTLGVNTPVVAQRSALDEACRPGTVRMSTTRAQEFVNLTLDLTEYYR